ncbi:hypothetical protein [Palleronia salina]|nr:hypothetical protein [Palleronia salina]
MTKNIVVKIGATPDRVSVATVIGRATKVVIRGDKRDPVAPDRR